MNEWNSIAIVRVHSQHVRFTIHFRYIGIAHHRLVVIVEGTTSLALALTHVRHLVVRLRAGIAVQPLRSAAISGVVIHLAHLRFESV